MSITIEIPPDLERQLNASRADLAHKAREAFFVELYRERCISHHQLAEVLGLERYETDGVLKRYGVGLDISVEEMKTQAGLLRDARP